MTIATRTWRRRPRKHTGNLEVSARAWSRGCKCAGCFTAHVEACEQRREQVRAAADQMLVAVVVIEKLPLSSRDPRLVRIIGSEDHWLAGELLYAIEAQEATSLIMRRLGVEYSTVRRIRDLVRAA